MVCPKISGDFGYGGELALVIGKPGMSGPRRSANAATARFHCRGIRPPEDG
jgi:hypothetical protein